MKFFRLVSAIFRGHEAQTGTGSLEQIDLGEKKRLPWKRSDHIISVRLGRIVPETSLNL